MAHSWLSARDPFVTPSGERSVMLHSCDSQRHRLVANSGRAIAATQLVSRPSVLPRSMKVRLRSARQSRPSSPTGEWPLDGTRRCRLCDSVRARVSAFAGGVTGFEHAGGDQGGDAGLHGRPALLGSFSAGPFRARGALLADTVAAEIGRVVTFGGIGRNERYVLGTRDREIEPIEGACGTPANQETGDRREVAVERLVQIERHARGPDRRVHQIADGFGHVIPGERDVGGPSVCRRVCDGGLHRPAPQPIEHLPSLLADVGERARALGRCEALVDQAVERGPRELPEVLGRVRGRRHGAFENHGTNARLVPPHVLHRQARAVGPAEERELRVLQRHPDRFKVFDRRARGDCARSAVFSSRVRHARTFWIGRKVSK